MTQQLILTPVTDLVEVSNDKVLTSSLKVAERFGKRHDNVVRAIEKLECSSAFRLLNFEESSFVTTRAKHYRCYRMTKDGFMFLVMGFTGEQAGQLKEMFIARYNEAEQILRGRDTGALLRCQKELAQVQRRLIATQRALIAAGRRELKLLRAQRPDAAQLSLGL